jgi:hypothetical protein
MRKLMILAMFLTSGSCYSQLRATYSCVSEVKSDTGLASTCMYTMKALASSVNFNWKSGQSPVKGILPKFNLVLEGYISVPKTDTYTFYVTSDDGSNLVIAEAIITNDYSDHGVRTTYGKINLEAGSKCKLILRYYNACCAGSLKVEVSTTTISRRVLPTEWTKPE